MKPKGFTLIEILVVVLIVGILAAVALPSYLRAVEYSRSGEAMSLLRAIYHAEKVFQMERGAFANSFNTLRWTFQGTPVTCQLSNSSPCYGYYNTEALQTKDWSVEIEKGKNASITVGRISGPYAGAGFFIQLKREDGIQFPLERVACLENTKGKYKYTKTAGSYCIDIIGGTYQGQSTVSRKYYMPF